jgi:TonB-linked SusC/RagA family outer membrane protein
MKKHLLMLWLVLFASIGLAMAQNRTVTGVVKGPDGETLPGVTVVLKGTSIGASTGADGAFSLSIPAENKTAVLRFSFIGYVSQELAVGSRTTLNITLASDTQSLDDVVVIGYQEVRRGDVTSAISSVNAQQIRDIPVNSAAEALTGRLAGVQLTSSEGTPGNNNVQVRVRGGGSITQDNSPLYIVDGIQIENALSVIAPQDIASVDVLKDASSTAIYGARGANGVVIITTKNGREGRTSVTYNGFAGFRKITKTLGVMGPTDYLNWEFERAQLVGVAAGTTGNLNTFKTVFGSLNYNSDTLNNLRNLPNQDWQRQVFGRSAFQQTHNVAISGGTKSTTFNLSLTRNNEDGIQLGSGYVRNLVNFRIDTKASDKFRLGFNARFNDQENLGAGTGAALGTSSTGQLVNTGSNTTSRLRNSVQYIPFNLPTGAGADPTVNFDPDFFNNSTLINPVLVSNNEYRSDKRRTFNMGATASFNILPTLVFRSTGGFDITYADLSTFNGYYSPTIRQAAGGYNTQPFITLTDGLTTTLNNSNVLDYTFKKDKHTFTALLGEETYRQRTTQYGVQVNYFPTDITAERALANINQAVLPIGINAQPVLPTTTIPVDYGLVSGFTRLSYDYDGKYLLSASARLDYSSKFEPGPNRRGVFPGASAAWRISQEDFFKDYLTKVSDLKLRVSYGQAGNNRIPDFLTKPLYQAGNVNYALNHVTTPATALTTLYNPDLRWEITTTRDVGVDVGFFNNRVQFTADVYYNTTHDLLISQPLPGFSGYTSQYRNIGSTSNKGLELQLSGTVVQTSNFTWTASANASFNRNKITDLGGLNEIPSIQSGWAGSALSGSDYVARVGQPVGQMYGYITDGFYTANDFKTYNYATRTGVLNDGVASDLSVTGNNLLSIGSLKLRDVNGDGQITEADKTVIGNANPKVIGGLNQQFTYKNFDASIFLNFVLGNDIYNANKIEFTTSTANTPYANLLSEMNNRVRYIDNNGALITDANTFNQVNANATMWSPVRGNYLLHSYAIENGSFLRVNNITVGYSLPKGLLSRVKVQSLRFYATLNNLYTFTSYSGYDPEVNTRRSTPLTPGVDYAAYPRSRAFLFGLNLGL